MLTTTLGHEVEPGCWIDGHWGRYGQARLIQLASDLGWEHSDRFDEIIFLAAIEQLDHMGPELGHMEYAAQLLFDWLGDNGRRIPDDLEAELLYAIQELATDVLDWMNNQLPDTGSDDTTYEWGWHEGELMLWPYSTWRED